MKIANLVIAILYSLMLIALAVNGVSTGNYNVLVGAIVLAAPVIINWFSYFLWPKSAAMPATNPAAPNMPTS